MNFKVGDYVTRPSHSQDIIFRIEKIVGKSALLRSYRIRLMADAPLTDLVKIEVKDKGRMKRELMMESYDYVQRQQRNLIINNKQVRKSNLESSYRERPGRVLHLDGDEDYLEMSLQNYRNLQIDATGFFIPEKGQPEKILEYIKYYQPDILVITGHDGVYKDNVYHTSEFFVKSVQIARSYEPDLDNLVIFAGACQSDYQQIIDGGANFASSPAGSLIHFLDPILVVEKIAYTSVREVIQVKDVVKSTITGEGGIGGIETRGKLRLCYP